MNDKFTDIAKQRNEQILQDKEDNKSPLVPEHRPLISEKQKNSALFKTLAIVVLTMVILVVFFIILRSSRGDEESVPAQDTTEDDQSAETTDTEDEQDEETDTTEEEEEASDTIDATEKEDSDSAEDAAEDSDFSQEIQTIGDESVDDVTISQIEQKSFTDFYRIIFTVESEDDFPMVTAELKAVSNLVLLQIYGISTDNSGITPGAGNDVTGSVVATVYHEITSVEKLAKYSIGIKETTGFYLHTLENPSRIVLDIEEQEITNGNGEEFSFSTDDQTIEGDVSGNVISMAGISYTNAGSAYRIIFKLGTIDSGTIPSATAEIVNYEGGKAVKLILSNMNSDFAASSNYDQSFSDSRVLGMKGSFENNTSTYYIKTSGEREYQLYYRKAPAQILVDVK